MCASLWESQVASHVPVVAGWSTYWQYHSRWKAVSLVLSAVRRHSVMPGEKITKETHARFAWTLPADAVPGQERKIQTPVGLRTVVVPEGVVNQQMYRHYCRTHSARLAALAQENQVIK